MRGTNFDDQLRRAGTIVTSAVALLALTAVVPGVAAAGTIDQPRGNPVTAPVDATGTLQPMTVVASGFAPGALVYVEQCDDTAPSSPQWDPTINCDLGSSPSPVTADARGVATFPASDVNRAFRPFVGPGPQAQFSCVAGGTPARASTPTFSQCAIRVSTNNTARTTDQAFVTLAFPANAKNGPPPPATTVPVAPTPTPRGGPSSTTVPGGSNRITAPGRSIAASSTTSSGGTGGTGGASSTTVAGSNASSKDDSNRGVTIAIAVIIGIAAVGGGLALERVLARRRAQRR